MQKVNNYLQKVSWELDISTSANPAFHYFIYIIKSYAKYTINDKKIIIIIEIKNKKKNSTQLTTAHLKCGR